MMLDFIKVKVERFWLTDEIMNELQYKRNQNAQDWQLDSRIYTVYDDHQARGCNDAKT